LVSDNGGMMQTQALPPTLGKHVCNWIQTNLVHGEGDFFGQPFILEPWQREFIYRLYEYDPVTLRRIVRRVLMVLPKGCGKTAIMAAICLAELAGPTTLDTHGRPALRKSPNIPVAAASREQANRLFGAARTMVDEGPLKPYIDTFQFEMQRKGDAGVITRVAAVDGTNDGGLPTVFAADEIHEWKTDRQRRVHLVIGNSLAKRAEGLELNISTPDAGDAGSLIGDMFAYGQRVANGEIDDPTFLFVWHHASEGYDLDDPLQLRAAIAEANPANWLDHERIAQRYEVDRIPEHEFRRYHLAQFVRGGERILPVGAWEACESDREIPLDAPIALGFDGSFARDSTALMASTIEECPHVWPVRVWERPANASSDWRVPRAEVDAAVDEMMTTRDVRELACDPALWPSEIADWKARYGEERVLDYPNSNVRMGPACQRFRNAVLESALTHDGSTVLTRHLSNGVTSPTRFGDVWKKSAKDSPHKIDAAIAAAIAHDRARWHYENPPVRHAAACIY